MDIDSIHSKWIERGIMQRVDEVNRHAMLRLITWARDGNVHLTIDGVIYKGFFVKAYDGFGEKIP